MSSFIELVLCDPRDPTKRTSLYYLVDDTPVARRHFSCIEGWKRDGEAIVTSGDAFYNFSPESDLADIADRINDCIDVINHHAPDTILHRAEHSMEQERLNCLHHYFERHRGPSLKPSQLFIAAPPNVQRALEDFNMLIHRYEKHVRHVRALEKGLFPRANIVVEFKIPPSRFFPRAMRKRFPLHDEDYALFETHAPFGTWSINYCEVGKPLWDVFVDGDSVVGDDNIRPLNYYSADATLQFCMYEPSEARAERERFSTWWDANSDKLSALGFSKGDPKNAIGHTPAARLVRDRGDIAGLSELAIVDWVRQHQRVVDVQAHGTSAAEAKRPAVTTPSGSFCWSDLGTPDLAASKRFYGALFGWEFVDLPVSTEPHYALCMLNGREVAALFSARGGGARWASYVTTDDANALGATAEAASGRAIILESRGHQALARDAHEMAFTPGVVDPCGGVLFVWTANLRGGPSEGGTVGAPGWYTLVTGEPSVVDFYTRVFGWSADAHAQTRFFATPGGEPFASLDVQSPSAKTQAPLPTWWCMHVVVADCDATLRAAHELGAKTVVPARELAGVGRVAIVRDPHSARFGILEKTR